MTAQTYNCTIRNGFSVCLGAANANDPAATVVGGVGQYVYQQSIPPSGAAVAAVVTQGSLVPNVGPGGSPQGYPYFVVSGARVALTAAQIAAHSHKLMPADAAAIAYFATLTPINVAAANQI